MNSSSCMSLNISNQPKRKNLYTLDELYNIDRRKMIYMGIPTNDTIQVHGIIKYKEKQTTFPLRTMWKQKRRWIREKSRIMLSAEVKMLKSTHRIVKISPRTIQIIDSRIRTLQTMKHMAATMKITKQNDKTQKWTTKTIRTWLRRYVLGNNRANRTGPDRKGMEL